MQVIIAPYLLIIVSNYKLTYKLQCKTIIVIQFNLI